MAKVLVKDGKGNIFEMEEALLEGENRIVTEDDIKQTPKIDVEALLKKGYITAEDYRKKHPERW